MLEKALFVLASISTRTLIWLLSVVKSVFRRDSETHLRRRLPVTSYDLYPTVFSRNGDVSEGHFIPQSLQHHEELPQLTLQHVY